MSKLWLRGARMLIAGVSTALLLQTGWWSGAWPDPTRAALAQEGVGVSIQAFAYSPAKLIVPVGTTVTWTNLDPVAHTVTDLDQTWTSPLFDESGTFSMTFTEAGTYNYFCLPHTIMVGTVEVTAQ